MNMRYVRKSRQESTSVYGGGTRTVYFTILQEFDGDKWQDVPTIDVIDIITGSNTNTDVDDK